jgi:hypothetical protein
MVNLRLLTKYGIVFILKRSLATNKPIHLVALLLKVWRYQYILYKKFVAYIIIGKIFFIIIVLSLFCPAIL